jgi:RNase adaptor protein for sRNA GlmZ degradation
MRVSCVDNLPAEMLSARSSICARRNSNIAVSIDVRSANSVQSA